MKTLQVELFGMARRLAQTKETSVEIGDDGTYRDVVAALARRYPAFVDQIIQRDTYELIDPYFLNVDARRVVRDLDEMPEEGKPLLLLFVDAGG